MNDRAVRIGIVAGEASGETLGAEIVQALQERYPKLELHGVGGERLQSLGLRTLFDPDEIAIVGVTAVVRKLPRLLRLIDMVARRLAEAEPDVVVLVDSPDFTHRVAAKLRARNPSIPIVKIVAPTVWAWRPKRAAALRPVIDEILAIFPFEPEVLKQLGGPPTTFIGHPLSARSWPDPRPASSDPHLLVLLGSRGTEIDRLAEPFQRTVELLRERIGELTVTVPTIPKREERVRELVSAWPFPATVVVGEDAKHTAFARADAALAASGTVTLELALANVPSVVAYKVDALERVVARNITTWAMAMPNIIADRVVMDELVTEMVRPERMARLLERLLAETPERQAQIEGFALVRERLKTQQVPAAIAAERIAAHVERS